MSRYELTPRNDQPDVIKAVVGWDRPLQTYFAQVFTRTEAEPEEGEATIWHGTEPGELLTPEAALAVVAPYAEVPETLAARLYADMLGTIGVRDRSDERRVGKEMSVRVALDGRRSIKKTN